MTELLSVVDSLVCCPKCNSKHINIVWGEWVSVCMDCKHKWKNEDPGPPMIEKKLADVTTMVFGAVSVAIGGGIIYRYTDDPLIWLAGLPLISLGLFWLIDSGRSLVGK